MFVSQFLLHVNGLTTPNLWATKVVYKLLILSLAVYYILNALYLRCLNTYKSVYLAIVVYLLLALLLLLLLFIYLMVAKYLCHFIVHEC